MTIIEGLPQLQRRIAAMSAAGSVAVMGAVANEFAATAQRLAPFETGALKASIHVASVLPHEAIIVAGGPSAPYARAQEYGAGLHPIVARNRPLLRFFWKKEGRWFRGKRVRHPGNPAQPFFRPAIATINLATKLKAEIVSLWNGAA